jgi:HEAT repeat protein
MLRLENCAAIIAITLVSVAMPANAQDDTDLVNVVIELLSDKDKDTRSLALEQVRTQAKGEAATKLFAAELSKLPADAQVGLLSALADRGDRAARTAVVDLLKSNKDEAVRVASIAALGPLGKTDDVALLTDLLDDDAKTIAPAARKSLVRLIDDGAGEAVAAEMKKAEPTLRVTLIEILVERRERSAIGELLAAAIDGNEKVRAAAMIALGELAAAEHVAGMTKGVLAAKTSAERAAAEKAVMFVCERIADPDKRAEPLIQAIDELKPDEQAIMLSTLGRIGGASALKRIEAAIADKDAKQRDFGIRSICNWPDASIAPRLIELATSAESPEHRTAALRALIRVAPLADKRTDAERLEMLDKAMKMAERDEERKLVLQRARAVRTVETLRYLMPYVDDAKLAEMACESVVELAHHRALRDANKDEFHKALDKVIATSKDAVVLDRANRYKRGETWVRPKPSK